MAIAGERSVQRSCLPTVLPNTASSQHAIVLAFLLGGGIRLGSQSYIASTLQRADTEEFLGRRQAFPIHKPQESLAQYQSSDDIDDETSPRALIPLGQ